MSGIRKSGPSAVISTVVHDLNSVLTVVIGYSDMLVNEMKPDESMHEPMLEVLRASERAAALTQKLSVAIRDLQLPPVVADNPDEKAA